MTPFLPTIQAKNIVSKGLEVSEYLRSKKARNMCVRTQEGSKVHEYCRDKKEEKGWARTEEGTAYCHELAGGSSPLQATAHHMQYTVYSMLYAVYRIQYTLRIMGTNPAYFLAFSSCNPLISWRLYYTDTLMLLCVSV